MSEEIGNLMTLGTDVARLTPCWDKALFSASSRFRSFVKCCSWYFKVSISLSRLSFFSCMWCSILNISYQTPLISLFISSPTNDEPATYSNERLPSIIARLQLLPCAGHSRQHLPWFIEFRHNGHAGARFAFSCSFKLSFASRTAEPCFA